MSPPPPYVTTNVRGKGITTAYSHSTTHYVRVYGHATLLACYKRRRSRSFPTSNTRISCIRVAIPPSTHPCEQDTPHPLHTQEDAVLSSCRPCAITCTVKTTTLMGTCCIVIVDIFLHRKSQTPMFQGRVCVLLNSCASSQSQEGKKIPPTL